MGILIKKRKTETVTITRELLRIHRPQDELIAWCRQCAYETQMILPEEAAAIAGVSTREIYRRVEIGRIHFAELSRGSLLICLNSIDHQASKPGNESLSVT